MRGFLISCVVGTIFGVALSSNGAGAEEAEVSYPGTFCHSMHDEADVEHDGHVFEYVGGGAIDVMCPLLTTSDFDSQTVWGAWSRRVRIYDNSASSDVFVSICRSPTEGSAGEATDRACGISRRTTGVEYRSVGHLAAPAGLPAPNATWYYQVTNLTQNSRILRYCATRGFSPISMCPATP